MCEDYPCCGHTIDDPCDVGARVTFVKRSRRDPEDDDPYGDD